MNSVAILVGNSKYKNSNNLDCCEADVIAMEALVRATEKHTIIKTLVNKTSAELKESIREIIKGLNQTDEFFFYFTGHGFQRNSEFYFCATDFDTAKPNETGLSNTELHDFLKSTNPKFVVKIVDACYAGSHLVKSDNELFLETKGSFTNVVQIASCLNSQEALSGDPLSEFTQSFQDAVLDKEDGQIYYLDIISSLKDKYINNNHQTPHFVVQGATREVFVDSASKFNSLRQKLAPIIDKETTDETPQEQSVETPLSDLDMLIAMEGKFPLKDDAESFISSFFAALTEKFSKDLLFEDYFEFETVEKNHYDCDGMRPFMVQILGKENRPDNFVNAESKQVKKREPYWQYGLGSALEMIGRRPEYKTEYYLYLNATFEKIQLKIIFKPKFKSLKRFELVIACAPSLHTCYVFEYLSIHALNDWDTFEDDGAEINRRWYKFDWKKDTASLILNLYLLVEDTLKKHIEKVVNS